MIFVSYIFQVFRRYLPTIFLELPLPNHGGGWKKPPVYLSLWKIIPYRNQIEPVFFFVSSGLPALQAWPIIWWQSSTAGRQSTPRGDDSTADCCSSFVLEDTAAVPPPVCSCHRIPVRARVCRLNIVSSSSPWPLWFGGVFGDSFAFPATPTNHLKLLPAVKRGLIFVSSRPCSELATWSLRTRRVLHDWVICQASTSTTTPI